MLHVVLTVVPHGRRDAARDVVVCAGGHRQVSELADDLAAWLGLAPSEVPYGLVVERTGEHLVPERRLDQIDLREGDVLTLLPPGATLGSTGSRRPLRRLSDSP